MPLPALPAEAEAAARRFRQFYDELFTVKQALRDGDVAVLLGGRPVAGSIEEPLTRAVQTRLRRAIAAQGFGGGGIPAAAGGVDPGYVMAAVADEALLHDVDWPGHDLWAETPLEEILYRSRIAGDRLFQAIDILIARRAPDPDGVAMTILLALEVGFRGRFHGRDDHGEIEQQKLRLYELVFRTRYGEPDDFGSRIAGAAEPLSGRAPIQLPSLRPWGLATGTLVVGYLLVSWLIWWGNVSAVVDSAERVTGSLHGLL